MDVVNWLNSSAVAFVHSLTGPALTFVMRYLTESFYVVLLLTFAYLYFKKDKNAYPFAFALVVMFILSEILKDIFKEPRPCADGNYAWLSNVACESGYAFPSSHAMSLTGLFIFLKNFRYLRAAYIIWLVVILFSRVYLGQHYFTDIIAGGAISIVICYIIFKYEKYVNDLAERVVGAVLKKIGAVK